MFGEINTVIYERWRTRDNVSENRLWMASYSMNSILYNRNAFNVMIFMNIINITLRVFL